MISLDLATEPSLVSPAHGTDVYTQNNQVQVLMEAKIWFLFLHNQNPLETVIQIIILFNHTLKAHEPPKSCASATLDIVLLPAYINCKN